MATKLILSRRELNPDPFYNLGSGWTYGLGWSQTTGAEKPAGIALSNLALTDTTILKPYKEYKWKVRLEYNTAPLGQYLNFIVGGVTIYNFPASVSPTIYEGTFTTGALTTCLFESSGNNAVLLSWFNLVESPSEYELDLTEEITVPLTMAIADIRDPSKRDATFSRTVNIPASKANNRFFNHIYEINGAGSYNPNKKVRALIINDGVLQFKGFCKLDRINRLSNGAGRYPPVSYDITLFGTIADLFYAIGDKLISELDFSEYDHIYSRQNQIDSWYSNIIKNGAPYNNTVDGSYITVIASTFNAGRVKMTFQNPHPFIAGDWVLFPIGSIVSGSYVDAQNYYLGEHMIYEVNSLTEVTLQCPYYAPAGSITTQTTGFNRVRRHYKKGEGYVYPMIDYDQNNGFAWNANQFYPGIYALEIANKIFKYIGCTFDSQILNSFIVKKFILPYSSGNLKLSETEIFNRLFSAGNTNDQLNTFTISPEYWPGGGPYKGHRLGANTPPTVIDVAIDNDATLGFYDNNGVFNTGTFKYLCSASGIYTLKAGAGIYWCWQNVAGVTQADFFTYNTDGVVQLEIYNYTTNAIVGTCLQQFSSTGPWANSSQSASGAELLISVDNLSLIGGQSYGVRFRVVTPPEKCFGTAGGITPYASNITVNYGVFGSPAVATFSNQIKNTNIQQGDTVYMNSILPKMKCSEFLNNLIKMINLYVDVDKTYEKKYLIETRDDYYAGGIEVDWTDKFHSGEPMQITPMGEITGKLLNYNYSEDGDFYNKDHKEIYGTIYGNRSHKVDNDFANSNNDSNVTFAPTVLVDSLGKTLSNIQGSTDTNGAQDPFTGKQRILIFNCASAVSSTWYHTINIGDITEAAGTGHAFRLYPYAGHLDKPDAPYYDLNFDFPKGVYFPYDAWTDRNLWNLYHKKGVIEITDPDARLVTLVAHLKASDIFSLDFRNRFKIDGHLLRLNKVSDFLVGKNIPVKCEFIKINDKPNFVSYEGGVIEGGNLGIGFSQADVGFSLGLPKYAGQGNANSQGAKSGVFIQGASQVGSGSYNVVVNGNGNVLGNNSYNMIVTGDNNLVYPNLNNVVAINCNGLIITESNKSYLNGQDVTNIQAKILRLST